MHACSMQDGMKTNLVWLKMNEMNGLTYSKHTVRLEGDMNSTEVLEWLVEKKMTFGLAQHNMSVWRNGELFRKPDVYCREYHFQSANDALLFKLTWGGE